MITHVVGHLYHLGITMGAGELAEYVKQCRSIVALDRAREVYGKPLYEDNDCAIRALAFHYNLKENGDGYAGLDCKTQQLKVQWKRNGLSLTQVPLFEDTLGISVEIYTLCEDHSVVLRFLSEEQH